LQHRLNTAYATAKTNTEKAFDNQARQYDKHAKIRGFEPGQWVFLYQPVGKSGESKKFRRPWVGPLKVVQRLSDVNYKIENTDGTYRNVHVNKLKGAFMRDTLGTTPSGGDADEEPWDEVLTPEPEPFVPWESAVYDSDDDIDEDSARLEDQCGETDQFSGRDAEEAGQSETDSPPSPPDNVILDPSFVPHPTTQITPRSPYPLRSRTRTDR